MFFTRDLSAVVGALYCVCLLVAMCTAQDGDADTPSLLPDELQRASTILMMASIFCSGCLPPPIRPPIFDVDPPLLCQQLCRVDGILGSRQVCWPVEYSDDKCGADQNVVCGYEDAVVCRYEDRRGSCVLHTDTGQQYCICRDDSGAWPGEGSTESCEREDDLFVPGPRPTTQGSRDAATTPGQSPGGQQGGTRTPTNVAAVILGCLLALVFILVVIGLVGWYLRRQGKLCAPGRTKPPQPDESAQVDQKVNVAGAKTTHQLPEQLVPDKHEYTYVDSDRWQPGPTNPETGEAKLASDTKYNQEDHCYQELDKVENGKGTGGNPYTHGPVNTVASKGPSTHSSVDPVYFVLEKDTGGVDDSSANDGTTDPDYQTPTAPQSQGGNSGYEVATPVSSDPSSTYDTLDRSFNKGSTNKTKGCENDTGSGNYDHISRGDGNINQIFTEEPEIL